ncbi:hypothetical protein [Marinobacter sp. AN1]|uniref:hypothetical protein n=1 Tax=Marinobacter sp. AN1 TaxID=2886046 RepID=UPI00222E438F|nr:hypothetical protein [Marinobacter sp. AN1]UZD64732.1 hypothetical protein LJ360_14135 [Marinobacter sp. AN1]
MRPYQKLKNSDYDIIAYQVHISEIEQLIDNEPDSDVGFAVLGNWLIKGRKHYVDKIKSNFDYRKIVDDCTDEQNRATPLGDWYAEFTYPHRVRSQCEVKVLNTILESALTLTLPKRILVCWKNKSAYEISRKVGVSHKRSAYQKREKLIKAQCKKALYHIVRASVGLVRILKFKRSSRASMNNIGVLVGSSDIYRIVDGRYENPVTGEVRRELEKLNCNVIYMSSPHDSGDSYAKLKAYVRDEGAITPEAVIVYYAFRHPLTLLLSLIDRVNPLQNDSKAFYRLIVQAFKEFLEATSVDAVLLSGEYSRIPRSAITAANDMSIPTAGMQHGAIAPRHPGYSLRHYSARVTTPKSLLLHGDAYRTLLEELHDEYCPKCWVVGNPATKINNIIGDIKDQTLDSDRCFNVLFASQPQLRPLLREAFDNIPRARQNNAIKATFKLHPAYEASGDFFKSERFQVFFKAIDVLPVISDVDLALSDADVVVSRTSTILQESLSQGIFTIEVLDEASDYSLTETFAKNGCLENCLVVRAGDLPQVLIDLQRSGLNGTCNDESSTPSRLCSINMPYTTVSEWVNYLFDS